MKIIKKIAEMQNASQRLKKIGKKIGFVPTMGFLHNGHIALIRKGKSLSDFLVVSIFVNPLQFGPEEDYKRYPRDIERDRKIIEDAGADILFLPEVKEMYPDGFETSVEVSKLSEHLCGKSRPGHFKGVATVVLKLFNIVMPDIAVFGKKDYQQYIIIEKMVRDLNLRVKIIPHPIVRERDGLAMSSRNVYLNDEERKSALCLIDSIKLAELLLKKGIRDTSFIINELRKKISSYPYTKIDYISIVDPYNLRDVKTIDGKILLALAVFVGRARLIDNKIMEV